MTRSVLAGALAVAACAGLLAAWFVSGWSDVRARQRELRAEPVRAAEQRTAELAHDLRAELQRIVQREVERPYFHYANLFHDPRSGGAANVNPSPLAGPPAEPLVLGYFQVDPEGRVSTPTINDDVPELTETTNQGRYFAFREQVRDHIAPAVRVARAVVVAAAVPQAAAPAQQQVLQLDDNAYFQNQISNANAIYRQQQAVPVPAPRPPPAVTKPRSATISIVHTGFDWRTFDYAGAAALVAVRRVETPDGTLAQGFVIDRAAVTSWLDARSANATIATGDGTAAAEIAPGWHLEVAANPHHLVEAAADAAAVARDFVIRFVGIGLIAAVAFAFIVALVVRAERLARERSQFAAAAAHELRTPLAGLQLYGEMLAEGLGDPAKLADYARRMSEEASRLGRVVSNVLGFSQLERGNLTLAVESRDLAAALGTIAERAQPALDRAGAALALEVAPELRARFDPDALARIVGNLLDNAEKYSRDAVDRTIELAARAVEDRVEIAVTDHGPGVAPHARRRLFRTFARGVDADGPAGLGLGLALSRSLAREMGGDLEYRPNDGGTRFVLALPA